MTYNPFEEIKLNKKEIVMVKNLEKIKKEFENSINDIWIIASLAHILKDSLEYNYEMRKLDRLYLASALVSFTDKQKYKLPDIKKDMFGL